MRPAYVYASAAGFSPLLRHDYYEPPFCVSLATYISSGGTATWSVQSILDDLSPASARPVILSQTTTVITVTDSGPPVPTGVTLNHGLSVGDYVEIRGANNTGATMDGEYTVASVGSATSYTVTSLTSQSTSSNSALVKTGRVFTHATLAGVSARQVGNYAFPVYASRINVTAYTSGVIVLEALQGAFSS